MDKDKALLVFGSLFLFVLLGSFMTLGDLYVNRPYLYCVNDYGVPQDFCEDENTLIFNSSGDSGWVEFIDNDYSQAIPLSITTASGINYFVMNNYSVRDADINFGAVPENFFNGSHVFVRSAGTSFIERWRYQFRTNAGTGGYCNILYDIGNGIPPLVLRQVQSPKSNGIWENATFTNIQYGLDTWFENGAEITIQCYNQNFEFANISFTYEELHRGNGVY